jgi:hypothetical protein
MPKYPLESLLEQRKRQVDDGSRALGRAVQGREAADVASAEAEAARCDAERRANESAAAEADLLAAGRLSAADLARGSAWAGVARANIEEHTRAVATAARAAEGAAMAESGARAHLASSMASRDVVANDQHRHADRTKKTELAKEEEAAEEAFNGRERR